MNNEHVEEILAAAAPKSPVAKACMIVLGRRGGDRAAAVELLRRLGLPRPSPPPALASSLSERIEDPKTTKADLVAAGAEAGIALDPKLKKSEMIDAIREKL